MFYFHDHTEYFACVPEIAVHLLLWGNCPCKKPSDVFSDIKTTILSLFSGGLNSG